MHEQPVFQKRGLFKQESCPVAENIARRGFYLPSGLALSNQQIQTVVKSLKTILNNKGIELSNTYKKQSELINKLMVENKKDEVIKYYKNKLDSLTSIIIKNRSIGKVLTDEKGRVITDDKGNAILLEDGKK